MPDWGINDWTFSGALHTDKIHPTAAHILDVKGTWHTKLVADSS